MRKIKLAKVKQDEMLFLQYICPAYARAIAKGDLAEYLLTDDIALRLWRSFRTKIESGKVLSTFSLAISDAVILLRACQWWDVDRSVYEKSTAEKYKGILDQQLKSINVIIEPNN